MTITKRITTFISVFAGIILIQACGRDLPAEKASCTEGSVSFVQNSNMQRVAWGHSDPIPLYIDASVPQEYIAAMEAAIHDWNEVGQNLRGTAFFELRFEQKGSATPTQDNYSKIYLLNTWESNRPSEQARTTIYWSGSRIYEADIRINEKNFDFYTGNISESNKVHLESLIVHELGHVLGLAHTENTNSVMQVSLADGMRRTDLASDAAALHCEY
jgi:hypothetical protein